MFSKEQFFKNLSNNRIRIPDLTKQKDVRGSNSGFLVDGKIAGKANHTCPRITLLRSMGIEVPPDRHSIMTWEVGFLWEKLFEEGAMDAFNKKIKAWKVYADKDEVSQVLEFGSKFSGRPDVVITFEDDSQVVIETKSVQSVNVAKDLAAGKYKPEYLAQITAYMDVLGISEGYLAFGAFVWGFGAKPDLTMLHVEIVDTGQIWVQGAPTGFSIQQQRLHRELLGWTNENGHFDADTRYVTADACKYCPFNKVCDSKPNKERFIDDARAIVEAKTQTKAV